ncbi:MAG: hypothetical protein CMF48_07215 [Legionellales bacterium]|nr:hypothetical protein [Legionellales bacterium]|tara:strand:+ start:1165 stop:1806 length:642 start_codon:yes stop_codon:yes gene_type:complete
MKFIAHRINDPQALEMLSPEYGVELDLRDEGGKLICRHDPFGTGPSFDSICQKWRHDIMVLNIKSERIEQAVLDTLSQYNIKNYFFLDSSMPMVVSLTESGESSVALRYSEYESIETVLRFTGQADWVWVDVFTNLTLTAQDAMRLKDAGFKLCLVCPELQKQPEKRPAYIQYLLKEKIVLDAICCKQHAIDEWKASYLVEIQTKISDRLPVT